jgi:glycosyltransferase involved in cell wall biosynthesis
MSNRIVYLIEDIHHPVGGVATVYRHVEILNIHGFTAFVGSRTKPATDFYETTAPLLIHGGHLQVKPGDVFVIPECWPHLVKALVGTPAKRLMFCQNQYYLPFTSDPRAGIAEFGVDGVIASSQAVKEFFRDVYGLTDLPLLPYAIDSARFAPAGRRQRQIAFMPRKLPEEAAFIQSVFRRRHSRYADVPWLPIERVTPKEAARIMGESACFLSLSHKESFGLPPLEAMACGCLVTGFHGDGGREYMTPENGWWAETGDYKACADGLVAALSVLDTGGPALAARRAAMAATVERYSPARLETALLTFWRSALSEFHFSEQNGQRLSVTFPEASTPPWWREWMPPIGLRAASRVRYYLRRFIKRRAYAGKYFAG